MSCVHYCAWCGHNAPAASSTVVTPACPRCGCALASCEATEWPAIERGLDTRPAPVKRVPGEESLGLIAALAVVPWLLPLIGMDLGDLPFIVPMVLSIFASDALHKASRRAVPGERQGLSILSAGAAVLAAACALGVVAAVADVPPIAAFYLGAVASLCLLGAVLFLAVPVVRRARLERILDAALLAVVITAAAGFFLIVPGFRFGDPVLSCVVLIDVLALIVAGVATVARERGPQRRVAVWILACAVLAVIGDGLVLVSSVWALSLPVGIAAALWAGCAACLSVAALPPRLERNRRRRRRRRRRQISARPRRSREGAIGSLAASICLPLMLAAGIVSHPGSLLWPVGWFAAAYVAAQLLVFHRQGFLLTAHRRSAVKERDLRELATRRNEELEALTGLATTMTQTLEEAPIVEQALGVLHLAARARSSALHLAGPDGRLAMRATAGEWAGDHPWADQPAGPEPECFRRGRRWIARLPLSARAHHIGVVTFVRQENQPFAERELELLRLLVDQMAVAVQNARDYREKLEQAVRDPLTGAYNRRFFFEALDKEVSRADRYGSSFSLVLFDVDHFKRINDTRGHSGGDAVLRGIVAAIEPLLRDTDSFARIGGEEFALLLPEAEELDALLVTERIRAAVSRATFVDGLRVTMSAGVGASVVGEERDELVRRVDGALYWAKRNGRDLAAVADERTQEGAESADEGQAAAAHLITLVGAIDAQHLHTRDHSENVALYAVALGQAAGLDPERLGRLRRAALLHDVGKVAVRPEVLEKPGALTDEEFAQIRLHPAVGATMLHHAGLAEESAWVRHHHERIDGRGYPDGLAGEDIPVEARIIFVADSFEAMTSDRPYRPGMSVADALAELRKCAGTQFQPELVQAFCELVETGRLEVMALRTAA